MELFGISIPVIQLAGGILICKTGWEFLFNGNNAKEPVVKGLPGDNTHNYDTLQDQLFFPITFPITTGAGTISVLFTLSAHSANDDFSSYLLNTAALMLSIVVICALVYFFYLNTKTLIRYMGSNGEKIVNRIAAFLIFCVGLQIAVAGIGVLVKM